MSSLFPRYGGRGVVDRMLLALRHPAAQHYWHRVGKLLEEQIEFAHDEALKKNDEHNTVKSQFDSIIDNNTWEKK